MRKRTAGASVGAKVWIISDGDLPPQSTGKLKSHESTCVLNLGSRSAAVKLVAYFGRFPSCVPTETHGAHPARFLKQ